MSEVKDAPEWTPADPRKDSQEELKIKYEVEAQKARDIEQMRKTTEGLKKKNVKLKRLFTGFFVAALCIVPIYMGPVFYIIESQFFAYRIFIELSRLDRADEKEDTQSWNKGLLGQGKLTRMQHVIYVTLMYAAVGKWMKPSLLIGSGYGPVEYPMLHNILYNWNMQITFSIMMIVIVRFVYDLRKETESYQFLRIAQTNIAACWIIIGITAHMNTINFGKGWQIFVDAIVSINDSCQLFAGMSFGRTKLIRLSPNKTLEGYIGGALTTMPFVFWLVTVLFSQEYYKCPSTHLTFAPFESEVCEPDPSFTPEEYRLPGGYSINMSLVQVYAMIIGAMCSFVAPFGGFLASGLKRAYGIKDFGTAFPEHGGFYDRMDSNLLANVVASMILEHTLFKDKFKTDDSLVMIEQLNDEEKQELLQWMEEQLQIEANYRIIDI